MATPQTIAATLPKPIKPSANHFPAIGTRFVVPKHLAGDQKAAVGTYIKWNVAALTSLKAGKMDRRVKPLSSSETFKVVKTQVAKTAEHPGSWGTIVERISKVQSSGGAVGFGVCMAIATGSGQKSKQSLAVLMGKRTSGWYVSRFEASPVKLPGC